MTAVTKFCVSPALKTPLRRIAATPGSWTTTRTVLYRLISETVTFYPVPDGSTAYTVQFYSVRQTQDADVANGQNIEIPYRFYEAYAAGLAWKLSEKNAPQLEDKMFARYTRAMEIAMRQDTENVGLTIIPGLGNYYV